MTIIACILYVLGAVLMVVAAGWYDEIENTRLTAPLRSWLAVLWPVFVAVLLVAVAIDRLRPISTSGPAPHKESP